MTQIPVNVPLSVRTAGGPFDIILGVGDEYMGFLTSGPAQIKQIASLAEVIRVGGESAYSNEAFSQLILNGFDGGGDREIFEAGDKRSNWSDGKVALGVEGRVTLASRWNESDADVIAEGREIVDFNATTCPQPWVLVPTANLRALNTTTMAWGDVLSSFTRTDFHLFANDQYLFFSFLSSGTRYGFRWDGSALLSGYTALGGVGVACKCLGWYKETLYCTVTSNLYPATNNNGSTWGTAIPVGYVGTSITDLYESNGLLFIAKPEGLFVYDEADVYMLLDAKVTYTLENFKGLCDWLGALYLPWLNAVHKGAVSTVTKMTNTDITPRMKGSTAKERYGHGIPVKMIAGPHRMFMAFNGGEGQYPEVLAHDGVGFQQVYRGQADDQMLAMGYTRQLDWLIINDGSTRIKKMINTGDVEYPDYEETGEFFAPFLDGGYPNELKLWRSITVDVEDCSTDNTVAIYYRETDADAWTLAATITENGQQEIMLDPTHGHVASRKIQFRFVLSRDADDETTTPKIKMPLIVRVMVSPLAIDGYYETIILAMDEILNNGLGKLSDTGYSQQSMREFLNILRNSPYPVTRIDEEGKVFSVKITDKSESGERPGNDTRPVRWNAALKYLDMRPGVTRQTDTSGLTITTGTITKTLFDWESFTAFGVGPIGLSACSG